MALFRQEMLQIGWRRPAITTSFSQEKKQTSRCAFEPQIFIDKDVATLLWNDVSAAAILLRGGLTC